jgi:glyoxylase-like metal-dependent hydrolase (beta-lactamase superfamily II)
MIDPGARSPQVIAIFEALATLGPLRDASVDRVIITHFHPDHIGMAGYFADRGATLWMTRTSWLQAKVMIGEHRNLPSIEQIQFLKQAGLQGFAIESYSRKPPSDYKNLVSPLPFSYNRLREGSVVPMLSSRSTVRIGNGHAAEHATLWLDNGLAFTGDQILPSHAPNLCAHPSDPYSNPVEEWIQTCRRFAEEVGDQHLCLPGHGVPFWGAATRCKQLVDALERTLNRLLESLAKPKTAVDALPVVFGRPLSGYELPFSIAEAWAFLVYLESRNMVCRLPGTVTRCDLAVRWIRCSKSSLSLSQDSEPNQPHSIGVKQ